MAAEDEMVSKTLALRIQGKIASKMSSKTLAKTVVDGPVSDIIDNCYRIAKLYLESKEEADKVLKNLIKIVVKIALLHKNNLLNEDELEMVDDFQHKFELICNTTIAFEKVDNTYDGDYLLKLVRESHQTLNDIVKRHFTDKSRNRVEHVYKLFADRNLLDVVFIPGNEYRPYLSAIVQSINSLIDTGVL